MPYGQVPHAEKHGVRIGLDISAVVFVIHLTKIKVKKIHPWVLWLEAYIPIMGWLTYQYYMTGAYKNKNKTKTNLQIQNPHNFIHLSNHQHAQL